MSTPAGWHRQDDGRERYWDGQQWTDQYRNPQVSTTETPADGASSRNSVGGIKPWMKYAGAGLIGLILGVLMGGGGGDADATNGAVATPAETATVSVTIESDTPAETVTIEPTLPAETFTVTAEPAAPEAAFGEGVYIVGEDIEPGRYRTIEAVLDSCYWAILVAGTNGADIIANDNVSGGRPTVDLEVGQEFESNRCGDWAKSE